ncbi:MAG: biopolymer transporter ExbD [Planctomycetota bacterium]|nr:biopolymer transporter ExbD [Planctomycetota bacterium]MDA1250387.1 biopolymer transporter ExbD [Planctomycetota bacterium]
MRVSARLHREKDRDDSFMTPMIDVVFLLLIFFVLASAGQVKESHLETPLSGGSVETTEKVDTPKPLGEVMIKLTINAATGRTVAELNDQRYDDWNELRGILRQLAAAAPEIPVTLDIAQGVPVGDFIDIYDTCRAANFDTVRWAARPRSRPRSAN